MTREAAELGCASVCLNPCFLGPAVRRLRDAEVDPERAPTVACTVVAFPLGASAGHTKSVEATTAVKAGAAEIDFVAHLPHLLACDLKAATDDFLAVTLPAREVSGDVIVKVIIESAALMSLGDPDAAEAERRIATACHAAAEAGCDFVKTSTGFHPAGGASTTAVRLMRKHATNLKVKASGGIRTRADADAMREAGADRLGCSATLAILGL